MTDMLKIGFILWCADAITITVGMIMILMYGTYPLEIFFIALILTVLAFIIAIVQIVIMIFGTEEKTKSSGESA